MSTFEVQILEPSGTILEIETISGSGVVNVDIIQSGSPIIEITEDLTLLPSEFNSLVNAQINSFISSGSGVSISSSPSGMIISSNLIAGSGVQLLYNSGTYIISAENSSIENLQDNIASFLTASTGISISYDDSNNLLYISTTGLQPSGNYSLIGHTHTTSDISNFNTVVSGLIPVKNITASSGINVSSVSGNFTIGVTGNFGLTSEEVDDRVSALLSAGSYINLNYNDLGNILTISATGVQPSGNYSVVGHSHISSDITDFNSAVNTIVNSGISTTIAAGTGIMLDYYSGSDTLTISTSGVSFVGHKHVANEINDFADAVKLIKLNDLAAPTGTVNLNNQKIINLSTPTASGDAANKYYIDNLLASTTIKGIASFDSGDFAVNSGIVTIKNSGIDNNQLAYNSIVLGSTSMALGLSYASLSGVTMDGGTP